MASIYKPKDKENWYISFLDPATGKTKNISTKLKATKQNWKKAEEFQKKIEEYVEKKKKEYSVLLFGKKTIKEAFAHFKKINSDKKPRTISGYEQFFIRFGEKIDINKPVTIINKALMEDWLINIKQINKAKNTIYNYFKILRKFLSFLFEYEYIPVFIINKNVKPRAETKAILVFNDEDQKKIIKSLEDKKIIKYLTSPGDIKEKRKKNTNFRTLIYLLNYTGLRPTDIIDITVEDVDLENLEFNYYSQKTDQYLTVPFHEILKPVLQERIEEVKTGKILNYATVGEMGRAFRRYLEQIELQGKGYNMRTFRKSFATKAFEKDIALMSAAALLGHKTISTTMKYYTKANRKKLAEELKKFNK